MIRNIQALRIAAACMVVFVHISPLLDALGFRKFGNGGVDLFFVISGFVMVHTTRTRATPPLDFARNRIARIVPIYWAMSLLAFAVALINPTWLYGATEDPAMLLKSLFFIPFEKSPEVIQPVLFVGWSLNFEMFFYAVFALGLALRRPLASYGFTAAAICGLILAGFVLRPESVAGRFYTSPMMLEFVMGMGLALAIDWIPASAGPRAKIAVLAVVLASLVGVALSPLNLTDPPTTLYAAPWAVLAVLGAVALERWGWGVRRRAWMVLGDASYMIYLSHPFVVLVALRVWGHLDPQFHWAAVGVVATVLQIVAAGLVLHFVVEKPLTRAARRLMASRPLRVQPAL